MKPIQYQKGYVEFYKLRFKVTPDVLIPRPETELLVDEALHFARSHLVRLKIMDVGTGSGNIAISLAYNLQGYNVKIIATDISSSALKIAKQNAKLDGVSDKIVFIKANLLYFNTRLYDRKKPPDIVITNLPYIPSSRIPYLDSSVKDFEPLIALDGGKDGFELYRKLFAQIKEKKWRPKLIIGEIDYTQEEIAYYEAKKYFPKAEVEVKFDLFKKQRILIIKKV